MTGVGQTKQANFLVRSFLEVKKSWTLSNKFLRAIQEQDVRLVAAMIDNGFDVDKKLINDYNGIAICAQRGWVEMAQLLIQKGCSLSLGTSQGYTPLHLAVMTRHIQVAKLLLQNRANVFSQDSNGLTPLHFACRVDDLEMAKLLMSQNKSGPQLLRIRCRKGETPFREACVNGSHDLIEYLLTQSPPINEIDRSGFIPLVNLVLFNVACTPRMLQLMIDHGADLNTPHYHLEPPVFVLLEKFEQDSSFRHVLYSALEKYDVNKFNFLGQSVLGRAIQIDDHDLVRKILNNGYHRLEQTNANRLKQTPCDVVLKVLLDSGLYDRSEWHGQRTLKSLKNACRAKIRNLVLPRRIEKVVDRLGLPNRLNNFVLLTC